MDVVALLRNSKGDSIRAEYGKLSILLFLCSAVLCAAPDSSSSVTEGAHCKPVFSETGDTFISPVSNEPPSYLTEIDTLLGRLYPGSHYLSRGGQSYVYRVGPLVTEEKDRVIVVPRYILTPRVLESYREQEKLSNLIPETGRVIRVRRVREAEGIPILEADFVPGKTLSSYLEKGEGPKSAEAIVNVMLQVGLGVADMHSVGISHGDVKPLNIQLSASPETPEVKATLLDLGLAAKFGEFPVAAVHSEGGTAEPVGTRAYLSKEKVKDRTPASPNDDFEAVARTYERLLFAGPTKEEDTRKIHLQSTSAITDVNPVFGMSPYGIYQSKWGAPPPNYEIVSALAYYYPWGSAKTFVEAHQKAQDAIAGKIDFFKDYYGPVLLKELAERDPARALGIVDTSPEIKGRYLRNELGLDAGTLGKIHGARVP